ncbi:MAG TPA: RNA methyltransferase [bacterium]|nr:RNA methyltransferase [bacterium]
MTFDSSKPSLVQSVQNSMVKHAYSLKVPKKLKIAEDFLCEGFHLVQEAFKSDLKLRFVFATKEGLNHPDGLVIQELAKRNKVRCFEVTPQIISYLSDTVSPQGMLAVVKKIDSTLPLQAEGLFLAVDQVQDAGNMGTLFRSAEAFGVKHIFLTEGCCDPFNPKVVRAAMGSLFRVPYMVGKTWNEYMDWAKENQVSSYALTLEGSQSLLETKFSNKSMIWVGSEGAGLPKELSDACTDRVLIPMAGQVESLNVSVAASIALFQAGLKISR